MTLVGKAKVIDGDTISVGRNRVRLHGIDAPESGQTCDNANGLSYKCGQVATDRLSALIGANEVQCEVKDKDRYGRLVAVCFSKQINLNEQLVFEGLVGQITEFSFLKKLHWEGDFDAVVSTEEYVMLNFLRGEKLGSGNQAIWSFKAQNNIDIQGQLRSARKDIIITEPFSFRGKCVFVGEG